MYMHSLHNCHLRSCNGRGAGYSNITPHCLRGAGKAAGPSAAAALTCPACALLSTAAGFCFGVHQLCVYVCVCVWMCVCVCVLVCLWLYACACVHVRVCVRMCLHVCPCVNRVYPYVYVALILILCTMYSVRVLCTMYYVILCTKYYTLILCTICVCASAHRSKAKDQPSQPHSTRPFPSTRAAHSHTPLRQTPGANCRQTKSLRK